MRTLDLLSPTAGARALGAPITPFQIVVQALVAALPSANNVSLLVERFGADNGRIADIMQSTTLAFVTFTPLAWEFVGAQ
jgi:predicted permease